jgi:hypothetical protein
MIPLAIGFLPVAVDLDTLGLDRANHLHDQPVVAHFIVEKPPFTFMGKS